MEKKTKDNFFSKIYSASWNQYIFLMEDRARCEKRFETILVLAGILVLVYFNLELHNINIFNQLGLAFLAVIYIVALYSIIPRKMWVPWVGELEFKKYRSNKDSEGFHKQLVVETNKLVGQLGHYRKRMNLYTRLCINFLLASSAMPILVFTYESNCILFSIILLFIVLLLFFFNLMFGKGIDYNPLNLISH